MRETLAAALVMNALMPVCISADILGASLKSVIFYNNGTVHSTDVFEYVPMAVSYNEPDNISCTMCGWAVHTPWHYEWQRVASKNGDVSQQTDGATCSLIKQENNTDHPGFDLSKDPYATPTYDACSQLCCEKQDCVGFLFESHSDFGNSVCRKGEGCCWLKSRTGSPSPKPSSVGAQYAQIAGRAPAPGPGPAPQPNVNQVKAPPTGYRSAPALGGVTTGSTELRADGSFRDWTIFNQGPAGSGKYGIVDDVYMGVKIGDTARIVRTTPPGFTNGTDGVDALTFSGTYPVTRLQLQDQQLPAQAEVFGYSTLKPVDLKGSAYPALVLSLVVTNPTSAPLNASFMLSVPFGGWTDCSRAGGSVFQGPKTYQECLHACSSPTNNCSAWQFIEDSGECMLSPTTGWTGHSVGSHCGVRSEKGWQLTPKGNGLFRSQRPEAQGPSMGDMTLQPTGGSASFIAADDPMKIWQAFKQDSAFVESGLGDVAHGAASVTTTVGAGENATLSIVFAWYFPDRDFSHQILGNMYATFWPDSAAVAQELASEEKLLSVVNDINTHHQLIANPNNPTPVWLKDMLVNQFSHFHMLMWYKDGRLREYEAWSCDDVDSVHNDYQRHLLYLWAFPEEEFNKMDAWSTFAQADDGHIWESLGYTGKLMDQGGGRIMGDTTTLYLLEMYEIMIHTGNISYVKAKWPSAKRAVQWMISNAGDFGLPQKLQTTYDHFGFNDRKTVVYNCHIYLTALKAVELMANAIGDPQTATMVSTAFEAGQKQLLAPVPQGPLWNDTLGFFLAHSETTSQVFTDSLYGQMLAHHFFDGQYTVDSSYIEKHLNYEWEQNQDLYGMRVLSSPIQEDTIWMNGPPTWTYLALSLGNMSWNDAVEPFKRMSENFRSRLNDMWNLRALTHSQTEGTELEHGQPREQGHYGFMLTDLYLLPFLSGQNVNMVEGKLTLAPHFPPPYTMPVLILGCEASLTATASTTNTLEYTLQVAFGELNVTTGGLSVSGCPWSGGGIIAAGHSVSWTC